MRATQVLSTEHRVIESVLASLARFSAQCRETGVVEESSAKQFVEFIRQFADRCHHGKEEGQLFAKMEALGAPRSDGPIGVMLHEHEVGRAFVRQMSEHVEAAARGDANSVEEFCRNADGYIGLLAAHIQKEDGILYPIADRMMSEQDQAELIHEFQKVEDEHMGAGTHEKFLLSAIELGERYGVDTAHIRQLLNGGSCGCSHGKKSTIHAIEQ